jgi:protein-S-isoprenylcysteine O-methyltransferase Ste14
MLMIVSLGLLISALYIMRKKGGAGRHRHDDSLFGFEKTTVLVECGIYRYIRHPMNSSLFFLLWGVLLRNFEINLLMVVLFGTAMLILSVLVEEKENLIYFGQEYRIYMKKTKSLIPFVL